MQPVNGDCAGALVLALPIVNHACLSRKFWLFSCVWNSDDNPNVADVVSALIKSPHISFYHPGVGIPQVMCICFYKLYLSLLWLHWLCTTVFPARPERSCTSPVFLVWRENVSSPFYIQVDNGHKFRCFKIKKKKSFHFTDILFKNNSQINRILICKSFILEGTPGR